MNKRICKVVIFLVSFFTVQFVYGRDSLAGEILSKFVFDWDGIFFVQPELESVTMYNNQFMLEWKKIDDVDGYIVYRKTKNNWKEIKVIKGSSNNWYFDKDINVEKSYMYTVSAYKKIKKSELPSMVEEKDNKKNKDKKEEFKFGKKDKSIKLVSRRDQFGMKYVMGPVVTKIENYSIEWEPCEDVDGYEISYRDSLDDQWEKLCTVKKNDIKYNLGGMYKKDRYYMVRAYHKTENKKVYSKGESLITLKDKKYEETSILFEGDDLIKGTKKEKNRFNYTKRVKDLTGAKVTVHAKEERKLKDLLKKVEKNKEYFKGYDIICIALGSNDYLQDVKIGNVTDNNKKSFYGQLNYILKKIEKQNSSAKIVFITPFYRNKYKKKENVNCYTLKNDKDFSLDDYANAMRQLGKYKGIYVYDSEKEGIVNVDNVKFMTTDLIHPTALAHGKIGCSFTSFLVEYELLKTTKR